MTSDRTSMKHVSHTPPSGEGVTNVWRRGPKAEREADEPADD